MKRLERSGPTILELRCPNRRAYPSVTTLQACRVDLRDLVRTGS